MTSSTPRLVRFGAGLAALMILGWVMAGQAAKPLPDGVSLTTDWSHRHLIFTRPRTPEQAATLAQDPRYWQQLQRMSQRLRPAVVAEASELPAASTGTSGNAAKLHRDWAENMGSLGAPNAAGNYPAKFSFNNTQANCASAAQPDYVVYSTSLAGSGTQASIVAYDNLYSGCTSGTVPTTYWAYDTAGGQILTSPIISRDGSQIAFAQTDGAGHGSLVLLKWAAGTGTAGSPQVLGSDSPATYATCTAPCMTAFTLLNRSSAQTDDQTSSVFYDYSSDTAWLGDSQGFVHKFNPVFSGTPAEVGGLWPAQVNLGTPSPLTSVVHDRTSGSLFTGDGSGFLYRVDATTAAVTQSGQLDFGVGIVEGPMVDVTSELIYVFASSDGSASCTGGADCSAVYQLSTAFLAGTTGAEVTTGTSTVTGTSPNPAYIGGFDNAYINSANATGNLYACGNTGLDPTLYQIPIIAGAFPITGVAFPITNLSIVTKAPTCSPVTDVYNPNTSGGPAERLFVSVQNFGISKACLSAGCMINFIDTPWQPSTAYTVGQEILDSKGRIETVITAGTSGATAPLWGNSAGTIKPDGPTLRWLNQGVLTAPTIGPWTANHTYLIGNRILDSNGNIEVAQTHGASGAGPGAPAFSTTAGGTTPDNAETWINAGSVATLALPEIGGTSGAIIDNVVGSGTLAGASQVYFSTLGNQPCGTSGTGGCAVQASQPALQ